MMLSPEHGRDPTEHPLHRNNKQHDLNVLAIFKGCREKFIFVYTDDSVQQLLDEWKSLVRDPSTGFTLYDAMALADRLPHQTNRNPPTRPESSENTI